MAHVGVIARIKSLGVPASAGVHVAAAAKRIRTYVEGPPQTALGTYYSEPERVAAGRAFGLLTPLLGLGEQISGGALEQLLAGVNPATGDEFFAQRQLAREPDGAAETDDDWHDLDSAARMVGVSARYLRRLAEERPRTNLRRAAKVTDERLARPIIEFLTGRVPAGKPRAFLLARSSESGTWLVHRTELARYASSRAVANRVMAYDLTLSAPKSVSLLWAFGDAESRSAIGDAFEIAIEAAIAYLERHATVAVISGQNRPGEGLVVVGYRHDVSREHDAHLHTHCIIANVTALTIHDGSPVWRALDGDVLMRHHLTAGYLAAAAFRRDLTARLGLEWGAVHHGVAEIASFPRSLLAHFSTRHRDIEREYAALLADGYTPGAKTAEAAQESTRAAKRVLADDEVLRVQTERLAVYGWQPSQVRELGSDECTPTPADDRIVEALFAELCGPNGLTERSVQFGSQDVIRAIASRIGDHVPTTRIEELADRLLLDERIVMSGALPTGRRHQQRERTYTTVDLLAAEDSLLTLHRQGQTSVSGIEHAPVDAGLREQVLRRWSERGLSDEQVNAVRDVLTSGDLLRVLVGPAGTGKTEAIRAAVDAWQRYGYVVIGTANGGRQAEQLHERLGVASEVVASWLTRLDNAEHPDEIWAPGTVLIVDEATQVSTRDAERLLRYAARTGTAIVAIGDPGQLSSVGAGGWFRHLASGESVPTLREMRRQDGDSMREVRAALTALRSQLPERVDDALQRLEADGRVRVCDDRAEVLASVVQDWYSARQLPSGSEPDDSGRRRDGPTRMMAAFQRDVELLNRAARVRLAADGTLTGPSLTASGREFRVGDEVVTLTQQGHTTVPDGASPQSYIRTGTVGTVVSIHADPANVDRQWLAINFPGRGIAKVPFAYLDHDFGDGRRGGLAHAYALTADRAQGSTMSAALAVTTDATSRQALYVMLSRAKHEVAAYVVRRRDLEIDPTDETWLPILADPRTAMERVAARLKASRAERLASDLDPDAWAAHTLASQHTLAEVTTLRREATPGDNMGLPPAIVRRAERIVEARVASAARLDPRAAVVDRLGPRPAVGAKRAAWDRAVGARAVLDARYPEGRPDRDDANDVRWYRLHLVAQRMVDGCLARAGIRDCPEGLRDATIGDVAAILAAGVDARVVAEELVRSEPRSAAALRGHAGSLAVAFRVDGQTFRGTAPLTWSQEQQRCEALAVEAQQLCGSDVGGAGRDEHLVSSRTAELG